MLLAQLKASIDAIAKSVVLAMGGLYIKQGLVLTDEKTVHQIQ